VTQFLGLFKYLEGKKGCTDMHDFKSKMRMLLPPFSRPPSLPSR